MLTLEVLYAVLMGLHPSYLTHLDVSWQVFCKRIHVALKEGRDPLTALQLALDQAIYGELEVIEKLLNEIQPVMKLPGLPRSQKETLIALRYAEVASLPQLTQTLVQDRSNVFRQLKALIAKGYALKFFRKDGIYYYAIPSPLDKSTKLAVNHLIVEQIRDHLAPTN